jgi:hypothetical protein
LNPSNPTFLLQHSHLLIFTVEEDAAAAAAAELEVVSSVKTAGLLSLAADGVLITS